MSTTFAVETEDCWIDVGFRGTCNQWLNPIAELLPDDLEVIATDNTAQGVETIGDLRRLIDDSNS